MRSSRTYQLIMTLLAIIIAALWVAPMILGVLNSLKTMQEIYQGFLQLPRKLSWTNYLGVWRTAHLDNYFMNSVLITGASAILVLFLACPAGYAFAKIRFAGSNFVFMTILTGLAIPVQIVLIPLYRLMDSLGLQDTYTGIIMIEATYCLAFSIFVMRNFFMGIPSSLADAARVDGCSEWGVFMRIFMPLSKPALGALVILTITWIWNDFLFPLIFIYSSSKRPITLGLAQLHGEHIAFWNLMMAGAVIASIVPLVIFIAFQKYFTQGLTAGAVKG
jgi:multiple sugar transport system permease protein